MEPPTCTSITGSSGIVSVIRITHRLPLAAARHGYDIFKDEEDGCEKVVLKP